METAIYVLAWIGLGAVSALSLATFYVWLDWLVVDCLVKLTKWNAIYRAITCLATMRSKDTSAYYLHHSYLLLAEENKPLADEFRRLVNDTTEEPCP